MYLLFYSFHTSIHHYVFNNRQWIMQNKDTRRNRKRNRNEKKKHDGKIRANNSLNKKV